MKTISKTAALCFAGLALVACDTPSVEFVPPKPTLRLVELTAVRTTIGSSQDELYFQFSDGTRFPAQSHIINQGQTWTPPIALDATGSGSIKLYEDDAISDDLIGEFTYAGPQEGTYRQTMTGDGSRYDLVWVVRLE
jgi:hypothetical protein